MEKKSKADIKKMIAELHQKPNGEAKPKQAAAGQANAGKGSSGGQKSKTYRPKI
ncbi:MAG: hypothetical protein IT203_00050 [Fimbriimonadaceae bacterium]|nr:hypothetical protein [Fimbriimonadaceae bacterium]